MATLIAGAVVIAQNGTPLNPNSKNVLTLAVYGDSPYGTSPTDTVQTDKTRAFINSINNDPQVDLVLDVGDIHSGSQFCTESYDRTIGDLWTLFKNPLVYTPGDNEWTDCHKKKQGGAARRSGGHRHRTAGGHVGSRANDLFREPWIRARRTAQARAHPGATVRSCPPVGQ
jgi:Calcineurin-like phosphoesterase